MILPDKHVAAIFRGGSMLMEKSNGLRGDQGLMKRKNKSESKYKCCWLECERLKRGTLINQPRKSFNILTRTDGKRKETAFWSDSEGFVNFDCLDKWSSGRHAFRQVSEEVMHNTYGWISTVWVDKSPFLSEKNSFKKGQK